MIIRFSNVLHSQVPLAEYQWQSYDQAVTGQHEEIQVPVLIVGGSLVGLSTALLLARHGTGGHRPAKVA
jgi:hypothetical protein